MINESGFSHFVVNQSYTLKEAGRACAITHEDLISYCGAADTQTLQAAITALVLLILACAYFGPVRGKGGLRARLLAHGWARTVGWLDGLVLPGAAFAVAIVVARLWMRS